MWALGYICRIPPSIVPNKVLALGLVLLIFLGGCLTGRFSGRGWKGGLWVGLIAGLINLLALGSLLGGSQPNEIHPAALWWIPGSFVFCMAVSATGAGLRQGSFTPKAAPVNWKAALAWTAASATFLLLIAGGLVTSQEAGLAVVDWPNSYGYNMFLYPLSRMTGGIYYEHAHRLLGALVGLTTLTLAIHYLWVEKRIWLRRLAWGALVLVIVQGILGGLRVTGHLTMSTSPEVMSPSIALAIAHGILGQIFFGLLVAIAVFSDSRWEKGEILATNPGVKTDRNLTTALVLMLIVQLAMGAVVRHISGGLIIHITLAIVILFHAVIGGARSWGLYPKIEVIRRLGLALMGAIVMQICLGIAAISVTGFFEDPDRSQPPTLEVLVTTSHQAVGALLLAISVALTLYLRRLVSNDESETV